MSVGAPEMPQAPQKDENPFGHEKFDAGIDADEESDPKNYIEKLTGKLAQKLRDYNGTESDTDLNKFVINSLIPAAIPQLDSSDAKDVIDKVQDNIKKEGEDIPQDNSAEMPADTGEMPQEDPMPQEEPIQQESKEPNIDELVNEILNRKKLSRNVGNKNPFQAPKFK